MHLLGVALNLGERSVALMVGAAVLLYVAGRAAADATAAGRPASGGRLAIGHWLPIAAVTVVAAFVGQPAVAIGIIFASAIGCLSLGLGTLAVVAPAPVVAPANAKRTWPLLIPAGLMAWVAGFHRDVRPTDAAALAVEALCVLLVWSDRKSDPVPTEPPAEPPALVPGWVPAWLRPVQLLLAVGVAIVGSYLAVQGLIWAAATNESATPGLLTATFLAPLAVLPILGTAADLARRGPAATTESASALMGVALLNACLGLPLALAAAVGRAWLKVRLAVDPNLLWGWHGWPAWLGLTPADLATTKPIAAVTPGEDGPWPAFARLVSSAPVPFPLAVWRVDLVVVVAVAVALIPVALGRWPLTRRQGVLLLAAFVAYLYVTLWVGTMNL
jgi:hypothetical protein